MTGTSQSKDLDTLISSSVLSVLSLAGKWGSALGFIFYSSHPCQKPDGDSWEAGDFGAIWFRQQKWRSNSSINFHRNIHLRAAALAGSFLGENRLMWNAVQVLTQRRCESEHSFLPEEEQWWSHVSLFFGSSSCEDAARRASNLCQKALRGRRRGPGINESLCLSVDKVNQINIWRRDLKLLIASCH